MKKHNKGIILSLFVIICAVITLIYGAVHISTVFKPFTDKSGGYVVEFPDLPGCVTEGKDLEQAIEMGIYAASGWTSVPMKKNMEKKL